MKRTHRRFDTRAGLMGLVACLLVVAPLCGISAAEEKAKQEPKKSTKVDPTRGPSIDSCLWRSMRAFWRSSE